MLWLCLKDVAETLTVTWDELSGGAKAENNVAIAVCKQSLST